MTASPLWLLRHRHHAGESPVTEPRGWKAEATGWLCVCGQGRHSSRPRPCRGSGRRTPTGRADPRAVYEVGFRQTAGTPALP